MFAMTTPTTPWTWWQKWFFRFFFLFYVLFLGPWDLLTVIPGSDFVLKYYYIASEAVAVFFNKLLFHIPPATKSPNGNGDYPEQWMQVSACLFLAVVGMVIWSVLDRKRPNYRTLNYWFCLGIRYFLILMGLVYGIIKLFCLQMPFPSISQFATPLGDFLPMRFSWLFVGASPQYEMFSGAIEVVAALLLMFRQTATLGVLVATGVFFNVMMLNLSYDIPVKINSISIVVLCFYLLAQETPRLIRFFFHLEAVPSPIFTWPFTTKRGRIIARSAKWVFLALVLYSQLEYPLVTARQNANSPRALPVSPGFYEVVLQTRQGDTLDLRAPDSVYWQNIVFENYNGGSIKTTDKRFRQVYGRGYAGLKYDSASQTIAFKRSYSDSVVLGRFTCHVKDSSWVELTSYPNTDSMYLLLRKRATPFPLSEKQFHWVSETNR